MKQIDLAQIRPNPHQARQRFDQGALQELADSIKLHGILNPVLVRPADGGFELVHGERRWRAAALAGLSEVPANVRDLSDRETVEIMLTENLQREDLTAIEEAEAFRAYIEDLGYTQAELAARVGRTQGHISNTLRLMKLHEFIRHLIISREISGRHGRELLGMEKQLDYDGTEEVDLHGIGLASWLSIGIDRDSDWNWQDCEQAAAMITILQYDAPACRFEGEGHLHGSPVREPLSTITRADLRACEFAARAAVYGWSVAQLRDRIAGTATLPPPLEPIVDPEFEKLLPQLTAEEQALLEADILAHGILNSLCVWRGMNILLDGHARLRIAQRHGIPYEVHEVDCADRDEAKRWMMRNQLSVRNLHPNGASYLHGSLMRVQEAAGPAAGNQVGHRGIGRAPGGPPWRV